MLMAFTGMLADILSNGASVEGLFISMFIGIGLGLIGFAWGYIGAVEDERSTNA